jgi:sugar phosphate isomerase/epimerase
MAFAKELGVKQMIVSSFGIKNNTAMSEWFQAADEMNRLGERSRKNGIQLGYHNHGFEFQEIDGVLIYDALMQRFDPEFVKMQFQVSVIKTGYKAATYFKKYPGRFLSSHLADWSPSKEKSVPVGQGVVEWKEFFTAAKIGGVKNFFVEMDSTALKESYPFLEDLQID